MGQRGEEETVQLWPFTLSMDTYLAPGVLEASTARHLMCTISRSWPWASRATQSGEQTVLAGSSSIADERGREHKERACLVNGCSLHAHPSCSWQEADSLRIPGY